MLDHSQHKQVLISILKGMYSKQTTRSVLGFKGGTAAMLFYGLPRMSVDLDFDLLTSDKEDVIFEYLKGTLGKYGKIKESYKKRYTLFFLLNYHVDATNVKVEISRRPSISAFEPKSYLGIGMNVMKREDMVANKLLALITRNRLATRDIFDVWFFLSNHWDINFEIIKTKTGQTQRQFFDRALNIVENVSSRKILHSLGELLNEKQKNWVRDNLKKETIFQLKLAREMNK